MKKITMPTNYSEMSLKELKALEKEYSNKVSKHDIFQLAFKILLNSFYGAVGSDRFTYYDLRLAEGVTSSGQLAVKTAINIINKALMKGTGVEDSVVAADTDSAYFCLDKMVEKHCEGMDDEEIVQWIDMFVQHVILKLVEEGYSSLQEYLNCPQNTMDMEREVIAKRALWSAKKQYAMLVHDMEGYRPDEPMLKIMGLAVKKSTTPEYLKDHLEICLRMILTDEPEPEIIKYKENLYKDFQTRHPSEFAINKSVNLITKYTGSDLMPIKGSPQNSRAAITHNFYCKQQNLDIPPIKQGDKIKLVQMQLPNPTGSNIFAFDTVFPEELLGYVNHEKSFEKAFTQPLQSVTTPIKWTLEDVSSLQGLI